MKPPRDMSAKEYARWLNEDCCLPYDEACRMAGFDPMAEYARDAKHFVIAVVAVSLMFVALAFVPDLPSVVAK